MNESNNEVSTDLASQGLSRRTMIAATAWTVPAVIAATSTPAMAASPGVVSFTGVACKHPGGSQSPFNKDYHFVLNIKNTTAVDVHVTITSFQKNPPSSSSTFSVGSGVAPVNTNPKTITVPTSAGSAGQAYIIHLRGDNSSNAPILLTYSYDGVPGQTAGVSEVNPCTFEPVDRVYP